MNRLSFIALIGFLSFCTRASASPVLMSAFGGSVPMFYQLGYANFGGNALDTSLITDSNSNTGITLVGLDNQNAGNVFIDTGTFTILKYQLDSGSPAFTFGALMQVSYGASQSPFDDNFTIDVFNVKTGLYDTAYLQAPAVTASYMFVTFDNDGNNGNSFKSTSLPDVVDANNVITLALTGGFWASINSPGFVTSHLYEVSGTVPEPSSISLLLLAAPILLRRRQPMFPY